jgi:hypothetical protein
LQSQRYRTEIVIPHDRTVILQLPQHLPEGRAVVIVQVEEATASQTQDHDVDHQDIEWWEEFEGDESTPDGTSTSTGGEP